ncbi:MAG: hypothetical protein FJ164_00495 [Gammaproteobacteria bacterium]|nr:hypothetical protein [Gammaproteobacteria bacterium]
MGRMPPEVMMSELSLLWQNVFSWVSWGLVLIMLLVAFVLGRRHRTPFYVFAIIAAGMGAWAEPLYDVAFDLWFHDVHDGQPGAMFSHFTAFGVVQPYWSHSGYIILYAAACLYAGKRMYDGGISPTLLGVIWVAEIFASCLFEVIGTSTGVYTYYGPYVMRLWNYPFVIGVLEGTQTTLFTVLAVLWWRKATRPIELAGLILLFPVTMLGANFGLGWPIIIALHLAEPTFSPALVWLGTLLSIALCSLAVLCISRFLPRAGDAALPARG